MLGLKGFSLEIISTKENLKDPDLNYFLSFSSLFRNFGSKREINVTFKKQLKSAYVLWFILDFIFVQWILLFGKIAVKN